MLPLECTSSLHPIEFLNGLWAIGLLTDFVLQAIQTTVGISQYGKASLIMGNINRHLNAAVKEETKAIEVFCTFFVKNWRSKEMTFYT